MYRWGTDDITRYLDFMKLLWSNDNKVLLVFDGKPGQYKVPEVEHRKAVAESAEKYAASLQESLRSCDLSAQERTIIEAAICTNLKKAARPTKEKRQRLKKVFYQQLIPMLKSTEEADELLVALNKEGDIDIVISGDTDLIRLGVKCLWVPKDDSGYEYTELEYDKVIASLALTEDQFQDMCILTGGIPQILMNTRLDIRKAWSYIRLYGTLDRVARKHNKIFVESPSSLKQTLFEVKNSIHSNSVSMWLREDETDRLEAWRSGMPAPYKY
jgi:5'-3' exonuclease